MSRAEPEYSPQMETGLVGGAGAGPYPTPAESGSLGALQSLRLKSCLMHTKAGGALWQGLRDPLMETETLRVAGGERPL